MGGLESLFRGLVYQQPQNIDPEIVDGVRNFLFGDPGQGGFDLAALNIQRGRDHGLADYTSVLMAYGLPPNVSFYSITHQLRSQSRLANAYGHINDIDLWMGGLAETHLSQSLVGPTFHAIILDQFLRLREGDRFWYLNDPFFLDHPELLKDITHTSLADIIRRNTTIGEEISDHVFLLSDCQFIRFPGMNHNDPSINWCFN